MVQRNGLTVHVSNKTHWEESSLIPGLPNDVSLRCLARLPRAALMRSRFVCKAWKTLFESKEFCELRLKIQSAEAWIYILTEQPFATPFKAFDPASNQWFSLPRTPMLPENTEWQGFACAALGPTLIVMGGVYLSKNEASQGLTGFVSSEVYIYSACTNQWSKGPCMNTARSWFAAAVVGDLLYVAGGQGNNCFLNSVEVYDPKKNSWSFVSSMHYARSSCCGLSKDGKLWIIGGEVQRNQHYIKPCRGSAEVYDPESKAWSVIPEMWLNREKVPGPTTVHDEKVLSVYQSKLMMFVDETHSWCHVGDLSGTDMFSNQSSRYGFGCVSLDKRLYIVGGMRMSKHYQNSVQCLNSIEVSDLPASSQGKSTYTKWQNLASMGNSEGTILASAVMTM
ncbi:hypothetical protein KP509_01G085400 [Ceratopteris richardii]|nr:hypothetical protein KP509_01G085400 [Ceratopteris richardii]